MPKISVVIPIYNSEKYLEECLDSVLSQSFDDIEVICVNDASTDNSLQILEKYRAGDDRLIVVNSEKSSAGGARNIGIALAQSEYIHFLDSDDYVEKDIYNLTYDKICSLDADVCIFEYNNLNIDKKSLHQSAVFAKIEDDDNIGKPIFYEDDKELFVYGAVVPWNKLYRKSFLLANGLEFDSLKCAEDRSFYFSVLSKNPKICILKQHLLNYRYNIVNSLSNMLDNESMNCHMKSFQKILNMFEGESEYVKNRLLDVCMNDIFYFCQKSREVLSAEQKEMLYKFFLKVVPQSLPRDNYQWMSFYKRIMNKKNVVPIVFATNDNYAPYMAVTIESLMENASTQRYYDLYVFYDYLSKQHKNKISLLNYKYENLGIEFININSYIENSELYSKSHYSKEMYYRLLIPEILQKYSKVLYLDCDLAVEDDVCCLYDIDIKDNLVGAVKNYTNHSMLKYVENVLGLEAEVYFNSGVMLFNNQECLSYKLKEKCLRILAEKPVLACPDQDILNLACLGRVVYIDLVWNFYWHHIVEENLKKAKEQMSYKEAFYAPKIIHYTTAKKPWNSPHSEFSECWWNYAKKTDFYEEILYNNLLSSTRKVDNLKTDSFYCDVFNFWKISCKYWRYKIFSKLFWGKKRKKYKEKYKQMKSKIKSIKKFLRGK